MSTPPADIIDLLAGIRPGDALDTVRSGRPQARENAQRSFEALLEPAVPGDFSLAERYAVAVFVSSLHDFAAATEFYGDLLGDEAADLIPVVTEAAAAASAPGPFGQYREPGLAAESTDGTRWSPEAGVARLSASVSPPLSRTRTCWSCARAKRVPKRCTASWMPDGLRMPSSRCRSSWRS